MRRVKVGAAGSREQIQQAVDNKMQREVERDIQQKVLNMRNKKMDKGMLQEMAVSMQ